MSIVKVEILVKYKNVLFALLHNIIMYSKRGCVKMLYH